MNENYFHLLKIYLSVNYTFSDDKNDYLPFFYKNSTIQEAPFHIWTWLKKLDASFGYSFDQCCVCLGDCIRN